MRRHARATRRREADDNDFGGRLPQREQKPYHQLGGQTTEAQGSASAALALPRRSWRGWDRVTTAVERELWALFQPVQETVKRFPARNICIGFLDTAIGGY